MALPNLITNTLLKKVMTTADAKKKSGWNADISSAFQPLFILVSHYCFSNTFTISAIYMV